jgi:MFS family permease
VLEFIKHNFRWIAGGFILTYFSSFGQTYFISASVSEWRAMFGLTHGEFGRLYMFATLASALCIPFFGRLIDVVQAHRMVALVVPILAGAALLAGYASSLPTLILAIFLLRLFGQGMMTNIALTSTARWFVTQRGRAVSLVVLGHQGGEATIPLAFAALSIAYGYSIGWLAAAIALIVIGLPFAYWCYRTPRALPRSASASLREQLGLPDTQPSMQPEVLPKVPSWTRGQVLRDPIFWVLLAGVLAPAFIGTTIFYHQNYLTALHSWPPQLFAMSLLVMALTTVCCALITGAAIDRLSATFILPYFLLPLGGACFVLAYSGPEITLFILMVLLGISYGIASTLFGALWPEIYGLANLGAVRSITVSAAVLATAIGPGVTGTLIDLGMSLPAQMIFLGVYCFLAAGAMAIASIFLQRRS